MLSKSNVQSPAVITKKLALESGAALVGSPLGTVSDETESARGINLARVKENEFLSLASANKNGVAVVKTQTGYFIYRHVGGDNWLEYVMTNSGEAAAGVDTPWKVTSQRLFRLQGYISVNDMTIGAGWSHIETLDPSSYTGYYAKQSAIDGSNISTTVNSQGELWLLFTGRTSGGICEVSVNGGAAVDVDTYNATDLTNKQAVKIASNLPSGAHTVSITVTNRKNAASTGYNILLEAIRVVDTTLKINSDYYRPKSWLPGVSYASHTEVRASNGRYYINENAGTSGNTEPTHTSGSASDDSIIWTYVAKSTYDGQESQIQVFGSELEYAFEFKENAADALTDIGGNIHGQEYITSFTVVMDGVELTMAVGDTFAGDRISIIQDVRQFLGAYATKTDVSYLRQTHDFSNACMQIRAKGDFLISGFVGFYYSAMCPFLTYYGTVWATKNFRNFYSPQFACDLADYENLTPNQLLGNKRDYCMVAEGLAYQTKSGTGSPAAIDSVIGMSIGCFIDPGSVDEYVNDPSVRAALSVNNNAGEYDTTSSWLSKMYFSRFYGGVDNPVGVGTGINHNARYYCQLQQNDVVF